MHPAITQVAELRHQGASRREIQRHTDPLARLCVGSYAVKPAGEEDEHCLRAIALVDRLEGVAASHTTAAIAHGLPVRKDFLGAVQLSALVGRRGKPKSGPGYRTHVRRVDPEWLVTVRGLRATDALRTVLDCARMVDADWGRDGDAALHQGLITSDALAAAAGSVTNLRGAGRARALAGRVRSSGAESPGESLTRLRLQRLGLDPEEQVELAVSGNPRVDFLVDRWLVVEFDGKAKYAMSGDVSLAHWEEKQRHDLIVEAGYEVVRITWAELWDEGRLKERIARAIRRAGLRHGHSARASFGDAGSRMAGSRQHSDNPLNTGTSEYSRHAGSVRAFSESLEDFGVSGRSRSLWAFSESLDVVGVRRHCRAGRARLGRAELPKGARLPSASWISPPSSRRCPPRCPWSAPSTSSFRSSGRSASCCACRISRSTTTTSAACTPVRCSPSPRPATGALVLGNFGNAPGARGAAGPVDASIRYRKIARGPVTAEATIGRDRRRVRHRRRARGRASQAALRHLAAQGLGPLLPGRPLDPPLPEGVDAVRTAERAGHGIVYLTGRPEWCRADTERWLEEHGLPDGPLTCATTGTAGPPG